MTAAEVRLRVGVVLVAYNAESSVASVLDRIPASFWDRQITVWVSDDGSVDDTFEAAAAWQRGSPERPIRVVRQGRNLGYGGNQKAGYRWAIDHGLDVVVLLHGDGQYAPELLGELVAPIEAGAADAVIGTRIHGRGGSALRGGMPLYKYVGNRILTTIQNRIAGTDLSEWHSGYRAYAVDALKATDFSANSDGFDFDTEILLQLISAGKRIAEIPIPTYYGQEISYVNGMRYAFDVMVDMVMWRLGRLGFGPGSLSSVGEGYRVHESDHGSHRTIVRRLSQRDPLRILDLGCSTGVLAAELRGLGHEVVGVDRDAAPGVHARVDRFVAGDLERGIPPEAGTGFDVVLMADVLEHISSPERLLTAARRVLAPGGHVLVSVPNVGHWYPRVRVALGIFDYDQRGILDSTHLRFFNRRTLKRLARATGFVAASEEPLGMPMDALGRKGSSGGLVGRVERLGLRVRPSLFAYQYLAELWPLGAEARRVESPHFHRAGVVTPVVEAGEAG